MTYRDRVSVCSVRSFWDEDTVRILAWLFAGVGLNVIRFSSLPAFLPGLFTYGF